MSCKILDSGYFTTIQDSGRRGYRSFGVPVSGPMDIISFRRANQLLGNSLDAAALECTLIGPTILFQKKTKIVLTGAKIKGMLGNRKIQMERPIVCFPGEILVLGRVLKNVRTYIAFENGIMSPKILGSHSLYFPVTDREKLKKGAVLFFNQNNERKKSKSVTAFDMDLSYLESTVAPEWHLLDELEKRMILGSLEVKANNRMGYRLESTISSKKRDILSAVVIPGTVQLSSSGQLLVVMADGQVTGGYYRVLQLTEEAISLLSQKKLGDILRFNLKNWTV